MFITRKSMISGDENGMELNVTQEQLDRYDRREGLLQDVFPLLSPGEREFIKTGITPEEWEEMFGSGEEDGAEDDPAD